MAMSYTAFYSHAQRAFEVKCETCGYEFTIDDRAAVLRNLNTILDEWVCEGCEMNFQAHMAEQERNYLDMLEWL